MKDSIKLKDATYPTEYMECSEINDGKLSFFQFRGGGNCTTIHLSYKCARYLAKWINEFTGVDKIGPESDFDCE